MSKGTTHRTFRCEDDLWDAAKAEFKARGKNISDEIRGFLRSEVEGGLLASPHNLAKAKAEALREAADELEYGNPVGQFLSDRADDIENETYN